MAVAVCTAGLMAAATLAWAEPGGDPPGANGTVKIDGQEIDGGIDNEPHVTCDFQLNFFNFDENEYATSSSPCIRRRATAPNCCAPTTCC